MAKYFSVSSYLDCTRTWLAFGLVLLAASAVLAVPTGSNPAVAPIARDFPLRVVFGNESFYVTVSTYDDETIETLRPLIAEKINVQPEQAVLRFRNTELVTGDQRLTDYGIGVYDNNPVVFVTVDQGGYAALEKGERIRVFYGTKGFHVAIPSMTESIATVKQLIEKRTDVPASRQVLAFRNQELDAQKTLDDYQIEQIEEPVLTLAEDVDSRGARMGSSRGETVRVFNGQEAFHVEIEPETRVRDAKAKIEGRIQVPAIEQTLEIDSSEMQNGYNVNNRIEGREKPVLIVARDLGM